MDESYQHYVEKGRQTHIHVPVRVHIHTHHKFTNTTPSQRTGKKTPPRVASMDCALACEPKDSLMDSQSGHMPGLRARCPTGVRERQPHIDISLPLFLFPFVSKNKKSFLQRFTVKETKLG